MKTTIRDLAKFLNVTEQSIYYKRKHKPKEFKILWLGWTVYLGCKEE